MTGQGEGRDGEKRQGEEGGQEEDENRKEMGLYGRESRPRGYF